MEHLFLHHEGVVAFGGGGCRLGAGLGGRFRVRLLWVRLGRFGHASSVAGFGPGGMASGQFLPAEQAVSPALR